MPHGLLIGDDLQVASWAFSNFKLFPTPFNVALGIMGKDGTVVGAALLQNFNGVNVELSYYGPNTLTPGIARSIARVVIGKLDAQRITVVTSKRNRRLMQSLLKFGFKLEGVQKRYYGAEDNKRNTGVRFVMFREDIARIAAGHAAHTTSGL